MQQFTRMHTIITDKGKAETRNKKAREKSKKSTRLGGQQHEGELLHVARLDGLRAVDHKVHHEVVRRVERHEVPARQPTVAAVPQQRQVAHEVHHRVPRRLVAVEPDLCVCMYQP